MQQPWQPSGRRRRVGATLRRTPPADRRSPRTAHVSACTAAASWVTQLRRGRRRVASRARTAPSARSLTHGSSLRHLGACGSRRCKGRMARPRSNRTGSPSSPPVGGDRSASPRSPTPWATGLCSRTSSGWCNRAHRHASRSRWRSAISSCWTRRSGRWPRWAFDGIRHTREHLEVPLVVPEPREPHRGRRATLCVAA
jgi:hypothetical protein